MELLTRCPSTKQFASVLYRWCWYDMRGTLLLSTFVCPCACAVCTRPCCERNALGQDDAEVQQELEMPMSSALSLYLNEGTAAAAAEAATDFDGGAPLAFLSVLHIHEQLKHDLRRSINPFRSADSCTAPQNTITNDATPVSLKRPCISVLGTAVLPLAHLLSASKKSVQRLDVVKEVDDPVCVMAGSDGKLKLIERLKLFQHQASGSVAAALVHSFEPSFVRIVLFCWYLAAVFSTY